MNVALTADIIWCVSIHLDNTEVGTVSVIIDVLPYSRVGQCLGSVGAVVHVVSV